LQLPFGAVLPGFLLAGAIVAGAPVLKRLEGR
jgi:hypothetical protein